MTENSSGDLGPVERVSLSDLYAHLPETSDNDAPFDVEAGLARLFRRIDHTETVTDAEHSSQDAYKEPRHLPVHREFDPDDSHLLHSPFPVEAAFAARHGHSDEVLLAQLELERLRLEQEHAIRQLELRHAFTLKRLDTEYSHQAKLQKLSDENKVSELEMRQLIRVRPLQAVARTIMFLAIIAISLATAIYNISAIYLVPLITLTAVYGTGILASVSTAVRAEDPARRDSGFKVLRLLLGVSLPSRNPSAPLDQGQPRRRRRSKHVSIHRN